MLAKLHKYLLSALESSANYKNEYPCVYCKVYRYQVFQMNVMISFWHGNLRHVKIMSLLFGNSQLQFSYLSCHFHTGLHCVAELTWFTTAGQTLQHAHNKISLFVVAGVGIWVWVITKKKQNFKNRGLTKIVSSAKAVLPKEKKQQKQTSRKTEKGKEIVIWLCVRIKKLLMLSLWNIYNLPIISMYILEGLLMENICAVKIWKTV